MQPRNGVTPPDNQGKRGWTIAFQPPLLKEVIATANVSFDQRTVNETALWANALLRSRDAWADKARNGKRYRDRDDDDRRPYQNRGGRYD